MKKFQKVAIFISAVLISLLAGCNKTSTQEVTKTETTNIASEVSEENILLKISEANTSETLMKNNNKAGYIKTEISSEGETTTYFYYQDKDKYVKTICCDNTEEYFIVNKSGISIHYDKTNQEYRSIVFIGERDECIQDFCLAKFEYEPLEKVTSISTKDDLLIIETETTDVSLLADIYEYYGYKSEEIKKETCYYEVDAKTYEIYKTLYDLHLKDGSVVNTGRREKVENYEEYLPSEELMNYDIERLEKRTVTIIENPGTPEEKTYKQEIPSGIECSIILSSEYEPNIYADPELKIKAELENFPDVDYTKDFTLYVRK